MPNPRLATRYAKSLLDLSIERDQLEQVFADMKWLQQVCRTNKDFVNLLSSPIVKGDTKKKILDAVTKGQLTALTAAFYSLLITKGRESNLPEIIQAFINQYKEHKHIHTLKLTTAVPVSDAVKKAIVDQVRKAGQMENIELEEHIDKDIIGGFRLQVGDQLVDASIAYDLKAIAKQFDNNDFIYKVR